MNMKLKTLTILTLLALALLVGCAAEEAAPPPPPAEEAPPPPPPPPASISVELTSRADVEVSGTVTFTVDCTGNTVLSYLAMVTKPLL